MRNEKNQVTSPYELSDEDRDHIRTVFHEDVVPRLIKLEARLGTLSCAFAGEQYKNWTVQFKSVGDDFEIVEFDYDEDGDNLDLDL